MLTIRPATDADLDEVAYVHASSWQVAYRGLVSDEFLDEIDPQAWAQRYRQRADPQRVTLLARDDGAPVGMVSFGPDRHVPERGEIYTIYVLPRRQNQGIGKQLMNAAITRLDRDVVHLWCAEGNVASQAFYESVGFTADGGRGTFAVAGVTLPTLRFTARRGRTQPIAAATCSSVSGSVAGAENDVRPGHGCDERVGDAAVAADE